MLFFKQQRMLLVQVLLLLLLLVVVIGKFMSDWGDGVSGNFNDWWVYTIATDTWRQLPDFPGSQRHHPFYFGIGMRGWVMPMGLLNGTGIP
jgi:hypothetical protein